METFIPGGETFHERLLRFPCNREWRTNKDSSHSSKHRATLFAHRREIAADSAKGGGTFCTKEDANF